MKKVLQKLLSKFRSILFSFYQPHHNEFIIKNIPYYSQWETISLVDDIYNKKIDARFDPHWKKSGAKDPLEYLHWSWSICGIACLKMILGKPTPIITLAKNGLKHGFYSINPLPYQQENYVNSIDGLKYKPFVKYLNSKLPLFAKIVNHLSIPEIIYYLDQNYFVIASVNAKIRDPSSTPTKVGGHLILILGYDTTKKTLTFHNPSGIYRKSQKYASVTFTQFAKFFASKGIIVKSK